MSVYKDFDGFFEQWFLGEMEQHYADILDACIILEMICIQNRFESFVKDISESEEIEVKNVMQRLTRFRERFLKLYSDR